MGVGKYILQSIVTKSCHLRRKIMTTILANIKNLFIISFFTSLLLGIVTFSAYFIKIQYFPVSNLSSIVYLPVIVGLTAFTLLASLAGLISCSAYFWAELLKGKDTCRLIVGEKNTEDVIRDYRNGRIDLNIENRKWVFIWYTGVTCFCFGLWFVASLLENDIFFTLLLILGFIGKYWVLLNPKKNDTSSLANLQKSNKKIVIRPFTQTICFSLLSSLPLFLAYLGLAKLIELKGTFSFVFFAIVVIFVSSICLLPFSKKWKLLNWTMFVSAVSIICFISIFSVLTNLSTKIMRLFKFGHMENSSILVDEVGCNIFKVNGFDMDCAENQKQYQINGINILWRANECYVQKATQPTIKFTLPEKHILSINLLEG